MFTEKYKVYIRTKDNLVTEVNSSAFITDTEGWIKIDEGTGDKYHHAQGNYFDLPIINFEDGTHNYIYKDGTVRETTEEEKAKERASMPAPQSTPEERMEQEQLEVLALMVEAVIDEMSVVMGDEDW